MSIISYRNFYESFPTPLNNSILTRKPPIGIHNYYLAEIFNRRSFMSNSLITNAIKKAQKNGWPTKQLADEICKIQKNIPRKELINHCVKAGYNRNSVSGTLSGKHYEDASKNKMYPNLDYTSKKHWNQKPIPYESEEKELARQFIYKGTARIKSILTLCADGKELPYIRRLNNSASIIGVERDFNVFKKLKANSRKIEKFLPINDDIFNVLQHQGIVSDFINADFTGYMSSGKVKFLEGFNKSNAKIICITLQNYKEGLRNQPSDWKTRMTRKFRRSENITRDVAAFYMNNYELIEEHEYTHSRTPMIVLKFRLRK